MGQPYEGEQEPSQFNDQEERNDITEKRCYIFTEKEDYCVILKDNDDSMQYITGSFSNENFQQRN